MPKQIKHILAMDISQIIRRFGLGNLSIICSGAALFLCFLKYCFDYGTAIRFNIASAQIIDSQHVMLIEVAAKIPPAIILLVLNGIAFYLSIKADEIVPEKKQTLSLGPRVKQALIALLIYMFLGLMFCLAIAIPILITDGVNALFLELYSHSIEYLLYVVIYGFSFLILGWVPGRALAFLYRHRLTSSRQGIGTRNGSVEVYLEQKRPRLDLQNTLCIIAIGAALCFYALFMGYSSIESPYQYKRAFPSEINSSKDNEFNDKHLSRDQWVVVFEKSSMYCLEKYSITSDGELTIDTSSHVWVNAENILISDLSYSRIVLKNHLENDEK